MIEEDTMLACMTIQVHVQLTHTNTQVFKREELGEAARSFNPRTPEADDFL